MDPAIFISSGVTLAGIVAGYRGGVQKGKADLTVERERTEQLREGRAEQHRKERREIYMDALNQATELANGLTEGGMRIPAINYQLSELDKRVNAVLTSGANATHAPAQEMLAALRNFDHASHDTNLFDSAKAAFVAAANQDVGPLSPQAAYHLDRQSN